VIRTVPDGQTAVGQLQPWRLSVRISRKRTGLEVSFREPRDETRRREERHCPRLQPGRLSRQGLGVEVLRQGLRRHLEFEKSNFSDRYSLSVTFDIRSLETKTNTSSHITISGHRLISDPSAIELLGDFEIPKEVGNTTRTTAVLKAIERELIPLVLRMTTMDALRSAYKAGGLQNALIRKEARAVLD
jgi:hypothetical protein